MTAAGWVHLPKSEHHRAFVARLALEFDGVSRPEGGADVDVRFHGEALNRTESSQLLVLGPDSSEAMLEAVEFGAAGYVPVTRSLSDIVDAAVRVSCRQAAIPDEMLGALLRRVVQSRRRKSDQTRLLSALTPREREVFDLAARGLDKFAIATHLGMSSATARTHLGNIMQKMDIRSRAELVALAAAMGIETSPLGD